MPLRSSTLKRAVQAAMYAVGDVKEAVTYRRSSSVYNPSTGSIVTTNEDHSLTGVFARFLNLEVDRVDVQAFDVKFIYEQRLAPFLPPKTESDVILRASDGRTYHIIRYTEDPAKAIIILQLRAVN